MRISRATRIRATRVTGRIRGKVEGAALIAAAMNAHACELVFEAKAESVFPLDPGEDIVDRPGSTGGQISVASGGVIVAQLRVAAAESHLRQVGAVGYSRHRGQICLAVQRVIAFVAAQVAEGGVIGHQAVERVCSQLKRWIGAFSGFAGLAVERAMGRSLCAFTPLNCHQKV